MLTEPDLLDPHGQSSPPPARSFLSEFPKKAAWLPSLLFALTATVISLGCWQWPEWKDALAANPRLILHDHQWYRLVTSLFVHSNLKHLLSNLLFIVPFGGLLTNYFGWRMFPWIALALGILTQWISIMTYPMLIRLVGASGMLYVMFGLWLSLYYKAESHLPWQKRWLRILGFGLVMMVPSQLLPHVSYRTHYIGLGIGLISGWVYYLLNRDSWDERNRRLDHPSESGRDEESG